MPIFLQLQDLITDAVGNFFSEQAKIMQPLDTSVVLCLFFFSEETILNLTKYLPFSS